MSIHCMVQYHYCQGTLPDTVQEVTPSNQSGQEHQIRRSKKRANHPAVESWILIHESGDEYNSSQNILAIMACQWTIVSN